MADLGEEAFSSQMKVVATFLRLLEELMRNKQQDLRYGTKTQRRGILGRMKDFVGGIFKKVYDGTFGRLSRNGKDYGQGWCAAWVTNVFQSAGIGYFGGNACDMCRAYCTSTNVRDLKVGMIIADVSHPGTGEAGRLYGHVGIYIGDNKVISNEGAITIKSLQEFVGFYGKGTGCKWGWLGGVDLSK